MYSNDRVEPFLQMQEFLKEMPQYKDCQKTLVVDGKPKKIYEDWDFVEIPRVSGKFCWGRMWDAGVLSARNESILYLDSDRLLPKNYLTKVIDKIKDDVFLFTSSHFLMHKVLSTDLCREFLEDENCFGGSKFLGAIQYDPRFKDPVHGASKNVMSGSTAFTKKTYLRLGGVDHWYCGHGAYADTDFHYKASLGGCRFVDLKLPELHYMHSKSDNEGKLITSDQLKLLSLDNFIYYCEKWGLPLVLVENVALKAMIKDPKKYVAQRAKLLRESPRNRFE
jgi:GT2 family glycosyltransferase